jgi:hypothetical protein
MITRSNGPKYFIPVLMANRIFIDGNTPQRSFRDDWSKYTNSIPRINGEVTSPFSAVIASGGKDTAASIYIHGLNR